MTMTRLNSTLPTEYDPEKARQERNAYMREYRKKHAETVREINRRYWAKRAERNQEQEVSDNA